MKIKIKVNKDGKVKTIKSDIPIDLARFSIERITSKPNRYKIERSIRSKLVRCIKAAVYKIGYIFISTVKAFAYACKTASSNEDVPRHQNSEA